MRHQGAAPGNTVDWQDTIPGYPQKAPVRTPKTQIVPLVKSALQSLRFAPRDAIKQNPPHIQNLLGLDSGVDAICRLGVVGEEIG
jgi:hypothetical protein